MKNVCVYKLMFLKHPSCLTVAFPLHFVFLPISKFLSALFPFPSVPLPFFKLFPHFHSSTTHLSSLQ